MSSNDNTSPELKERQRQEAAKLAASLDGLLPNVYVNPVAQDASDARGHVLHAATTLLESIKLAEHENDEDGAQDLMKDAAASLKNALELIE